MGDSPCAERPALLEGLDWKQKGVYSQAPVGQNRDLNLERCGQSQRCHCGEKI